MLGEFRQRVLRKVEPRHASGRIKQWLNLLRRNYIQAERLFQQIRSLKTIVEIDCVFAATGIATAGIKWRHRTRLQPMLRRAA